MKSNPEISLFVKVIFFLCLSLYFNSPSSRFLFIFFFLIILKIKIIAESLFVLLVMLGEFNIYLVLSTKSAGFIFFISFHYWIFSLLKKKKRLMEHFLMDGISMSFFWSFLGRSVDFQQQFSYGFLSLLLPKLYTEEKLIYFFRYLNVLLKEFAHSIEMVLTALLTAAYFGHPLTLNVLLSIFLVGVAILLSYLAREKNG